MKRASLRALLLMSAIPVALFGGKGWAQEQARSSRMAVADAAATDNSADTLSEIVVTAERHSENIQEVPIAVTAISPNQIRDQGIVTSQDVQLVTPGLTFTNDQNFSAPYIRGIGTSLAEPGIENAVAVYVDGAYITRSAATIANLFDMAGVQVLNGAQGTLYGRNATGGAILYTTADPALGKFSANAMGEYGNYDHAVGELVANVPIGDKLALRVGVRDYYQNGYVTNIVNGTKLGGKSDQVVRAKLKWVPSDNFSAVASFEYTQGLDNTDFYQERLPAPYCGACGIPIPGANLNPVSGFYNATNNPAARPWDSYSMTGNVHFEYSSDQFDITSVTSLEQDKSHGIVDTGLASTFSLFDYDTIQAGRTFGEELQAVSKLSGMFNGMVGVSINHDQGREADGLNGLAFAPLTKLAALNEVTTNSYSGFGEVYVTPTDRLKLTGGLRYTLDQREVVGIDSPTAALALDPANRTLLRFALNKSFSAYTGRAVVDYNLDPVNLYASWNRGFKAGGYNTPVFAPEGPVSPETIDDYEAGAKYLSEDHRVRLSVGAFYYLYSNMQVQCVSPQTGGLTLQNAATARGYGAEFSGDYDAVSWMNLFGTLSLLNARFTSYPNASDTVLVPNVGLVPGKENLKGNPLPQAPDVTFSAGFDFHKPIGEDLTAHLNVMARYSSKFQFYPGGGGPQNFASQPAFAIVNISGDIERDLTASGSDGFGLKSYKIGFFIYNATGKKYYLTRDVLAGEGQYDIAAPPRTFGLRLSAAM